MRSIVLDENNVIRAGNGTVEEAGQIGIEKVRVIDADGDEIIAVRRKGLTEAEWKEYAVADNRSSDLSEWDAKVLAELSEEIDLSGLFFEDELAELLNTEDVQVADEPVGVDDEEALAEQLEKADSGEIESRVSLGQIWKLGRHYICCGDSTDEGNVRKLLGDRRFCLIHADPPYGMGKEKDGVMNDNLYREKLDAFQMQWWKACRYAIEDNGSAYIWGNAEDLWRLWYAGGLKDSERLTFRNEIVWDKQSGQGMLSDQHRMFPTASERCMFFMLGEQGFNNNADNYWKGWEPIQEYLKSQRVLMGWDGRKIKEVAGHNGSGHGDHWTGRSQWTMPTEAVYKAWQAEASGKAFKREYDDLKREWYTTRAYFDNTHENMTDVWTYPRVQGEERWSHATPKPVAMISRIYKSSSAEDGLIYSPFLGSGTDIIAAQQMEGERKVVGFELSPEYCTIILERFQRFSGINAELVGSL
jgi:DNA modification methylase